MSEHTFLILNPFYPLIMLKVYCDVWQALCSVYTICKQNEDYQGMKREITTGFLGFDNLTLLFPFSL